MCALCKVVAGEHGLHLGTGKGPAKSLGVRLRGWTNADDHCLIQETKQMKSFPDSWKKPCDRMSWCSSGTPTTLMGQGGNGAGSKQPRRLLERVGDNLFVPIIKEPGDALLDLLLRNKENLVGVQRWRLAFTTATMKWWGLTS